jgi:hypothetical protein
MKNYQISITLLNRIQTLMTKNMCQTYSRAAMLCALLLLSCVAQAQVSELTASVDRNPILADESFNLTLLATGSVDRDDVDFSALSNDFRVGRPSFSMSTQIINGSMTRNVSWTLNLQPKQTGRFEIPAFEIDGQASKPFFVEVLPVDSMNTNQPRDFYVSAEVNKSDLYLQQQLLYTLRIHLSRDIQRGNLDLPDLDGALIEQIGEDRDYQDIIDGVRYRIIERKYAIIPQSSGQFTIGGPVFEADVLTNSRQSFANFGRTRSITRRAPDIAIDVKPIPDDYNYTWLPSEFVEVTEEWQGDSDNLVVGDPITRTITITAMGLTKEQLPVVNTPYHPDFKVYPEQPELATAETDTALVSQSTLNTAIIPSKSGTYVLPEVRVPWFNVNTQQTEFALIPAKTVTVSDKPANRQAMQQTDTSLPDNSAVDMPLDSQNNTPTLDTGTYQFPDWLVYLLITSNLLTLVLVVVMWASRKTVIVTNAPTKSVTKPSYTGSEAVLFNQLKANLEQGKLEQTGAQLDAWLALLLGAQHHSVSLSLLKHGNKGNADGASNDENELLDFYNQILAQQSGHSTSPDNEGVDFMAFIKALQSMRKSLLKLNHHSVLTGMYPK